MGIRSERRLCEEVDLNLAYRWFCRLDLGDPVPDHSTFSKNRHGRFRDSNLFRKLFEDVLARCIAEGLVGGEVFGVDASLIKADANREDGIAPQRSQRRVPHRSQRPEPQKARKDDPHPRVMVGKPALVATHNPAKKRLFQRYRPEAVIRRLNLERP